MGDIARSSTRRSLSKYVFDIRAKLYYLRQYTVSYYLCNNKRKLCVFVVQTSGLSTEVTASSSADLAEIEQIVKERMVNFESETVL